jgi:hypothetical protein
MGLEGNEYAVLVRQILREDTPIGMYEKNTKIRV